MARDELIYITLKQLEKSFKTSPECLQLEDASVAPTKESFPGPTIIWKHLIEIDGKNIQDPNNSSRTIIITYNKMAKELSCYIYFREVTNIRNAISPDAKSEVNWDVPILHRSYRKFMSLRRKLIKRHEEHERMHFLRKLSTVFPATFTDDLLE